ncbi:MAG: tyrosine-type recombinase/integrase [Elusimicrobia bacterium]|nr:tyrosine-type recombinase/integrase [Elusimicrobiota bacterium]
MVPETLRDFAARDKKRPNPMLPGRAVGAKRHAATLVGIRNFFQWLAAKGIISSDPTPGLGLPPTERPEKIIPPLSEIQRLLNAADLSTPVGYRDRAILEVLYSTGISRRELMALKVDDVGLKDRTLHVASRKGKKARLLPLSASAAGYLGEYLGRVRPMFANALRKGVGALFLNQIGTTFSRYDFVYIFQRVLKRSGMKKSVTATTLRNSLAAHLLDNGMSVRAVQEFMGRRSR